jgi:V/A-type H+-transporting ATPase subunit E
MAGIGEILNIIDSQQKQTESSIISAAKKRAERIIAEGNDKAEQAYNEAVRRSGDQLERDYINSCASADADIKRKILSYKVELIDKVIEKTLDKLATLPSEEYFSVVLELIRKRTRAGKGVLSFNKRDLERIPESFRAGLDSIKDTEITISTVPADIDNGFILTYGLVSENCSFRDIMVSERESVRDTAARVLFGKVSK